MNNLISTITKVESNVYRNTLDFVSYLNKHPLLRSILISAAIISASKLLKLVKNRVKYNTILEIDFTTTVDPSDIEINPIERLLDPSIISFRDILNSIEKGAKDKKVIGLVVRLGGENNHFSLTNIQEFRMAVSNFKKAGKKTIVFTDSFTEAGSGIARYYMASVFESVYMAPSGTLNLINTQYDFAFVKNTLDKLGVTPQVLKRKEYKNALNSLENEQLTDAEKESMNSLFKSIYEQIIKDISIDRGLTVDRVNELFEVGPFSSDTALTNKLIDSTLYGDEVYKTAYEKLDITKEKASLLYAHKYNAKTKPLYNTGGRKKFTERNYGTIALINAEGGIHQGSSKSRFNSGPSIGSESLVLAIRAATLDKDVKAIVIRVSSPGGSYIASDQVHHEIEVAKKAGKKIVISMGTYCASGGYFFACVADSIVALPSTITGSIGVLTAKLNFQPMWNKLGVKFDNLRLNPDGATENSSYFSSLHSYNEKQLSEVNGYLDFIYEDFTSKVSRGRRLTRDQVENIARGRVWTGNQALANSLVDKIGGLYDAIDEAKRLISIPSNITPHVVTYPKESLISMLTSTSPNSSQDVDKRGFPASATISSQTISSIGIVSSIFSKFNSFSKVLIGNGTSNTINSIINQNNSIDNSLTMDINTHSSLF